MRLWLIPAAYLAVTLTAGFVLPRLEAAYLGELVHGMSVSTALAFFSAVSSGMMALMGIVFAIAFVMVQFSAMAYSPRLVVMMAGQPTMYHALGVFMATFTYSLVALVWTDRGGSGKVPLASALLVGLLLVGSMAFFARMIEMLTELQISNVLDNLGGKGRAVIRSLFRRLTDDTDRDQDAKGNAPLQLGPVTQTLTYSGWPRSIAKFDIGALVRMAQDSDAVIEMVCAVGDTLVEDSAVLRVHGAARPLPEPALLRAIHLARTRTFDQDPKYAIRILVDIAIRALSPAINDPTTAVQALDQIEDLMRRLGRSVLDAGRAHDRDGKLRLVFPMPTWVDYLALSFDEIRQYGTTSVQVARRLRSALTGLASTVASPSRRETVLRYLAHLDRGVQRSGLDDQDQTAAMQEDRQGLGLSRSQTGG